RVRLRLAAGAQCEHRDQGTRSAPGSALHPHHWVVVVALGVLGVAVELVSGLGEPDAPIEVPVLLVEPMLEPLAAVSVLGVVAGAVVAVSVDGTGAGTLPE